MERCIFPQVGGSFAREKLIGDTERDVRVCGLTKITLFTKSCFASSAIILWFRFHIVVQGMKPKQIMLKVVAFFFLVVAIDFVWIKGFQC